MSRPQRLQPRTKKHHPLLRCAALPRIVHRGAENWRGLGSLRHAFPLLIQGTLVGVHPCGFWRVGDPRLYPWTKQEASSRVSKLRSPPSAPPRVASKPTAWFPFNDLRSTAHFHQVLVVSFVSLCLTKSSVTAIQARDSRVCFALFLLTGTFPFTYLPVRKGGQLVPDLADKTHAGCGRLFRRCAPAVRPGFEPCPVHAIPHASVLEPRSLFAYAWHAEG
jgi:hypothetical protein